jgi:hypothetical protein
VGRSMTAYSRRTGTLPRAVERADLLEQLAEHPDLPFSIVVAPSRGRFLPSVTDGPVTVGQVLGHVTGAHGRRDAVLAQNAGHLKATLRLPRQPVRCGTGLFCIGPL